jgi:hypothetical protein
VTGFRRSRNRVRRTHSWKIAGRYDKEVWTATITTTELDDRAHRTSN